jgi:hypothetical protein
VDLRQLRILLQGAQGKEATIDQIVKLLGPYRQGAATRVRDIIVQGLPNASLLREREFKELERIITEVLGDYSNQLLRQLNRSVPTTAESIRAEVLGQLRAVGLPDPVEGLEIPLSADDYMDEIRVADRTLPGLLAATAAKPSPFALSNMASINRFVRSEIFKGTPSEDIATDVFTQVVKKLRGQTQILSVSSVYDFDRIVRNEIEDANAEKILFAGLKWEWVTLLDSKTCPRCGPRDGEIQEQKEDFGSPNPSSPGKVHTNCRCGLLLIKPEDEDQVRKAHIISENKLTGDDAYKRKRTTKGTKYWEKTEDYKGTYAEWLASEAKKANTKNKLDMRKSSQTGRRDIDMHTLTLREALGSSAKTQRFIKLIDRGESPHTALLTVIRAR